VDIETVSDRSPTRAERVRLASRERRDLQKQELREKILRAAAELFVETGYERFSLRQVAERIGYSATTIYLYFENKDDLLFEAVADGWARFSEDFLAAASSEGSPLDRLRAMGRAYVEFGIRNRAAYELMFVQRSDFLIHENPQTRGKPVDLFGLLFQTVAEAIEAGFFPPGNVETYSDALWAATHGIVSLCPEVVDSERRERAVEVVLSMALDGLQACQETPMPNDPDR
jgi:AcrR family transcriptional regulator